MAWTQAQLDELKAAYASGVMRIRHEDRWVEYRSGAEMERAIARIEAELAGASGTLRVRQYRLYQDGKGL
ncbi:hypothetical protein EDC65_2257 [Stella humosa]|uniref:GpW protein n=1 Tax=Stella humosa TaxID=94 RepID=A0A3N1M9Z5_9PROT|nr:hypothetical protein [Stella humosa]ROQ00458.1 hypothetical protein EDC65_2257 [Stella humosa]BBK30297.1 hypothetical protein STHU_09310 [Stella humosa]